MEYCGLYAFFPIKRFEKYATPSSYVDFSETSVDF
jgi:hypothetical protein